MSEESKLQPAAPPPEDATYDEQGIAYYKDEAGVEHRRFPSGVIQRLASNGQWLFAKGTAKRANFGPGDDARAALSARWERYRDAALAGVMDGTRSATDLDAVRALAEHATLHAMKGGAGGAPYLQQVRQMIGLAGPEGQPQRDADGNTQLTLADLRQLQSILHAEIDHRKDAPTTTAPDGRVVVNPE